MDPKITIMPIPWPSLNQTLLFQDIKVISDRNEKTQGFTKAEAGRVENLRYNRYRDVNPYDHSRVVLNGEQVTTDYINASLVKVRNYTQRKCTQGDTAGVGPTG